jgi:ATP-binding cassette subfamily B protein
VTFWTLFSYLKTHRVAMAVILVLLIGETGISLLIPYLVGQFTGLLAADAAPLVIAGVPLSVDLAADDAWQAGTLWWVLAIWVGLLILQMGLRFQTGFRTNVIGAHVLAHLSCQVYNHIQALPLSYFVIQRKGAVIALLSNDVQVVSFFLTGVLIGLVPALLLVLGVGTMMWILHPQIALVIMICVPLFFILVKILSRAIKPLSEQVVATQAQAVALVSDNVQQIGLVKAFNREAQSSAEFAANAQHLLALRSKMLTIQAFITPFMQLCIALGVLGIVLVSVINLQTAQITIAQMITLLLYGALFAKPMGVFAGLYGQVQQAQGAATRIIGLLNEPIEENTDALPDIDEDRDIEGRVRIQDLSFSYPQGEPLFAQVNFSVVPGQIGVIVGKNGRGKTTLLNLIMRFMEPDSGGISLDNKTIQSYNLTSIRRQFGLVSQDIALAHGTIKDNLMFGVVDHASISSEQLQHVLMITGICGFTDDLPLGIDTHIGENGIRLSGGQRQRIALARALLLATPILLFDEPTSFADNDTQQEFARLLREDLGNKTIIIVTHDPDLAQLADKVLSL